jgi:hypothetical protein
LRESDEARQRTLERARDGGGIVLGGDAGGQDRAARRVLDLDHRHAAGHQRAEQRGFPGNAVVQHAQRRPAGAVAAEIQHEVGSVVVARHGKPRRVHRIGKARSRDPVQHALEHEQESDRAGKPVRRPAANDRDVQARLPQAACQFRVRAAQAGRIDPQGDVPHCGLARAACVGETAAAADRPLVGRLCRSFGLRDLAERSRHRATSCGWDRTDSIRSA